VKLHLGNLNEPTVKWNKGNQKVSLEVVSWNICLVEDVELDLSSCYISYCHPITVIVLSELLNHWAVCLMEEQWASWDPKEGHLISSKNRWLWIIKRPPDYVSAVWGCFAVSLDCWSLAFWDRMVVSSTSVKMFMEKYGKHCVATWRLVDFCRDWRCYAGFTFWIQRLLIMNCSLGQVVRPEHVDVQSKLEGLEPVPDSDQSVYC